MSEKHGFSHVAEMGICGGFFNETSLALGITLMGEAGLQIEGYRATAVLGFGAWMLKELN